jgi:hypothetical protein
MGVKQKIPTAALNVKALSEMALSNGFTHGE